MTRNGSKIQGGRTPGSLFPACFPLAGLAVAAGVFVAATALPGAARAAECPAYPRVSFWGELSHRKTIDFVARKHGGNWASYIAKWEKLLARLEKIHARGNGVSFPRRSGLRLKGTRLAAYIEKMRKRNGVNLCLAERDVLRSVAALADFDTAAGPAPEPKAAGPAPEPKAAGPAPEPKAAGPAPGPKAAGPAPGPNPEPAANAIRLRVNTECTNGTAFFKIANIGGRWPKMGTFTVYRIDDRKLVWERTMRLTDGQKASFRVDTRKDGEAILGLWVEPSWYSRDFRYDAKLICG